MPDTIFNDYWKKKFADAPGGEPKNDPNVPYEHLKEYNGKRVFYSLISEGKNGWFHGSGNLTVSDSTLDVSSDSSRFTISRSNVTSIEWDEAEQCYILNNSIEISVVE